MGLMEKLCYININNIILKGILKWEVELLVV